MRSVQWDHGKSLQRVRRRWTERANPQASLASIRSQSWFGGFVIFLQARTSWERCATGVSPMALQGPKVQLLTLLPGSWGFLPEAFQRTCFWAFSLVFQLNRCLRASYPLLKYDVWLAGNSLLTNEVVIRKISPHTYVGRYQGSGVPLLPAQLLLPPQQWLPL